MSNQKHETGADSPPSANGYRLEYAAHDDSGKPIIRNLVASWPAPFFVLLTDCAPPLLYHANDRVDAERFAQFGGRILNADFSDEFSAD